MGIFDLDVALQMVQFAQLAYLANPDIQNCATDTQAIVRIWRGFVVVAFRGTSSLRDFVTDAEAWRCETELGGVHFGFASAWSSIAEKVFNALQPYGTRPVILCGHSLGGALAILGAALLRRHRVNVHSVYTFGAPRVGDKTFQQRYNATPVPGSPFANLGEATFTIIDDCDLVPRIPGWLAGFRRPGHDEFISSLNPNRLEEDPSVLRRLVSDIFSLTNEWAARRNPTFLEQVLVDHKLENYIKALVAIKNARLSA